jgi:heme-degrading monooxygenase HmoA
VLILQATFATAEGAAAFWGAAVPLMAALADAPGFIRRWSFPDGPSITLIALWRSVDDARAFGASPAHRAASADLFRERWQYSHFSALWELCSDHGRVVLCPACEATTRLPARRCRGCGAPIADPYAVEPNPA